MPKHFSICSARCTPAHRSASSKRRIVVVISAVLWGVVGKFTPDALGEPILFQPATNLHAGATPLVIGSYAVPCVTDWNGDGRKDLLAGYRTTDKIALYLNVGSDANPVFTTFTNLQAGGVDIYVEGAPSCGAPAPWVEDLDGDGRRDLLVGSGKTGQVYFYRNTNTDAAPILMAGVLLMTGTTPVNVAYRATPHVHDWDQDGLNDLLCGNGDGWVYCFQNTNTTQVPIFAPGVRLQAGGSEVNFGSRAVPRVLDWDGDGLKDLVVSSSTGVYWCRNTNNNPSPVLQIQVALKAPVSGLGLQPINTSSRMRLDLTDWNNDGAVDLLLGNVDGTISLFEGYRFALSRLVPGTGGQFVLQWHSAPFLKYQVLAGPSVANLRSIVATGLLSNGRITGWTNVAPGNQQFYRVQIAP
jgi:hypothetical protein